MAPQPLQQGDPPQVGRYRLLSRLGAGGMGVVYLGQGPDGRQVAVKVLRPEYADDPEFRARFQREVSAMGRVRNRYTVQVLDADTESAMPFLATEYAEGPSLTEQVQAHGPLHPEAVIMLASALAEALAAIHAAGVTHRDLKPSNVLLTNSGPMVIDFGIAQVADAVSLTRTGMAIGSPGYMAPEQVTGHAGREADIFTWALMVAYAASGQSPFGGGPTAAILHRILTDEPDISAVPPRLIPLVRAALAKDPKRRPAAVDLLRELSPGAAAGLMAQTVVDREGPGGVRDNGYQNAARTRRMDAESGPRTAVGGWPETGPRTASRSWDEPRSGGSLRRWRVPAIVAGVLVVVVATGAALLSNNGGSHNGNNPSSGTGTVPTATGPAQPGAGAGAGGGDQPADTTTPAGQQGDDDGQQATTGPADDQGNGDGNTSGGGDGGSVTKPSPPTPPVSTPSQTVPTKPSIVPTGAASTPPATSTATPGAQQLAVRQLAVRPP